MYRSWSAIGCVDKNGDGGNVFEIIHCSDEWGKEFGVVLCYSKAGCIGK